MPDSYKPGQKINLTIKAEPRRERDIDTLERLMRFDPDHNRTLKKAQEHRMKTLVVRSRGKRPWAVRQRSASVVIPRTGESWTMQYFPHIAPDIKAVERFLEIAPA